MKIAERYIQAKVNYVKGSAMNQAAMLILNGLNNP